MRTKVSLHQHGRQIGNAGSFSSFIYGRRLVPKRLYNAYKAVSSQMYQTNISGSCNVTSGVHTGVIYRSKCFLRNNVYPSLAIQPYLLSTSNTINGSVGGNSTRKVLYQSVSGEVMLHNQDNMNVRVIPYDIIARKNLDSQINLTFV